MITIGMDIAMRSNGIVAIDQNNKIIDMMLVESNLNNEELILCIKNNIQTFMIDIYKSYFDLYEPYKPIYSDFFTINIERLSYNSFSAHKDLIAGIHWAIRSFLVSNLNIKANIIAPKEWQSKIIDSWDKVEYELKYPEQDMKKIIPYYKCPYKKEIDEYISSKDTIKKDAHFDLSDAYWIACHKK